MTWEELKEEAKKMGYVQGIWEDCITNGLFEFYKGGDIVVFGDIIAKKRTPDQMYAIMEALQ